MDDLIEQLKKYFEKNLGVKIETIPWVESKNLPLFLSLAYDFYQSSLYDRKILFMISKEQGESTSLVIQQHQKFIEERWTGPIVYVQERLSPHNRSRYAERQLSFVIPNFQMFLPHLGIDFTERFKRQITKRSKIYSSSTQAVAIYALLQKKEEEFTPTSVANELGYSLMTITRAFDELQNDNMGQFEKRGKERFWVPGDRKMLWEQISSHLNSPVKKRVWVEPCSGLVLAGESALSEKSNLAKPQKAVFAIGSQEWEKQPLEYSSEVGQGVEVEIWKYDPRLFSKEGSVDPLSLYLSLRETEDERIEIAIEEMMGTLEW